MVLKERSYTEHWAANKAKCIADTTNAKQNYKKVDMYKNRVHDRVDDFSMQSDLSSMGYFLIPLFHSSDVQPTACPVMLCHPQPNLRIIYI